MKQPTTDIEETVRDAALRMDAVLAFGLLDPEDLSLVLESLASTWPPGKVKHDRRELRLEKN